MEKATVGDTAKGEDRRVVPAAAHRVQVRVIVKVRRGEVELMSRGDGSIGSTESIDLRGMSMGVDIWSQESRRVGVEAETDTRWDGVEHRITVVSQSQGLEEDCMADDFFEAARNAYNLWATRAIWRYEIQ